MNRINIYDGVNLNVITSEKFKTNFMSVNFILPLDEKNAHLTALVPKILSRGCKKYTDMAKISERLEYLYASGIAPVYVKRAESLIVGFSADFIKDAFVPDETDLLECVSELLFGIIFDPLAENGSFREDYTYGEKTDLINFINSKINNKAAYAKEKCTAEMFKGHPYGISEYGTADDVRKATAKDAYDVVIADLPCSGLGIIGTKPEIKYRVTKQNEEELCCLQRKILDTIADYVKVGGTLLYSTCRVQ